MLKRSNAFIKRSYLTSEPIRIRKHEKRNEQIEHYYDNSTNGGEGSFEMTRNPDNPSSEAQHTISA